MQVDAGAEDGEEEVATEEPGVEQEEEHYEASVWEVDDSSSSTPSGHQAIEGGPLPVCRAGAVFARLVRVDFVS